MNKATISKLVTWILTFSVLCLVWIYPAIAHAQGTDISDATGSPVGDLLMMLMKVVFSVLGLVATYLTTMAINYFQKKTKIEIPASTEKMLFDWADQAVGLATEKAHQVLQQTGKSLNGPDKLNIAVQFVLDLAKKHNIDAIAEEQLKDYINAKLGAKRLDDVGVNPIPAPAPDVATK